MQQGEDLNLVPRSVRRPLGEGGVRVSAFHKPSKRLAVGKQFALLL